MIELACAKRILLAAIFALLASACSSLPDWANPDTWGDSSEQAASDESGTADQTSQGATVAEASDKYPTLADTPSKAPPTTSTDEQKQVANALVGDRAQAQYSAEQLRAGAEPSAAPPPPPSADSGAASGAVSEPSTAASAGAESEGASSTTASAPSGAAPPPPTPSQSAPAAHLASTAPKPPATTTPSAAPAAPASPSDDAALGFQPSHAPPLNPAVAQLVGSPAHPRLALANGSGPTAPSIAYGTPAATVMMGGGAALDANGLAQVRAAVALFRAKSGQGFVRVVGHAAHGSSPAQTLERAQACATAVARALIKLGVPAKKILVEASGRADSEQRRADIFLES